MGDLIRRRPLGVALMAVYAVGMFTYVEARVAGLPVPAILAGVAAPFLVLNNRDGIRREHLTALALILFVPVLTLGLAPEPVVMFSERFKALLFFVYSLVVAYALYLELTAWRRRELSAALGLVLVFLIVGVALELWTPLRAVSDAFRSEFFSVLDPRNSDAREQLIAGGLRPKFFTSETSHLAKWFLLGLAAWLAASRGPGRYLRFLLAAGAGAALIRSPITLGGLAVIVMALLYIDQERGVSGLLRRGDVRRLVLFAVVGLGAAVLVAAIGGTFLRGRLLRLVSGQDFSTLIRLVAPVFVAERVLTVYPLFGVGLGGNELLLTPVKESFVSLGIPLSSFAAEENLIQKVTNAFWLHWIYLGLAGGLAQIATLAAALRMFRVRHRGYLVVFVLMYANVQGAYYGARLWTAIFVILAVLTHLAREPGQDAPVLAEPVLPHPVPANG